MDRQFSCLDFLKMCHAEKEMQNKGVTELTFEIRCIEYYAFLEAFIIFRDLSVELSVIITGDI